MAMPVSMARFAECKYIHFVSFNSIYFHYSEQNYVQNVYSVVFSNTVNVYACTFST